MRGVEPLSIAGLIGLIVFAVWEGREWLPGLTSPPPATAVSALNQSATKEPERPVTSKRSSPGARSTARRESHDVIASNVSFSADSAILTASLSDQLNVSISARPVPDRNRISPGTTESQLKERYGEPALKVEKREGQLVEQYYYNSDEAHYVVVSLADGRVVSASLVAH
jgi:hypothetical protein